MRYRLAVVAAICFPAAVAYAQYTYVGPNNVNVAGSACRTARSDLEAKVYHDVGSTTIRSNGGQQRLYCPIPRRGTGVYGNIASGEKVNFSVVDIKAIDSSTAYTFTCSSFATDMFNQTTIWGASKTLCPQSTLGCSSYGASWTGGNTMRIAAPANLSSLYTVNFGVICDLGPQSTLTYLEAYVTPN